MDFLSKLPKILPFQNQQSSGEYYFALNIESERVAGLLWGLEGKSLEIISSVETPYTSEEQLIEAANLSLDEALADFLPEPSKILFGVPDNWLQDDNLKPEYLSHLKKLVKELDLSPMAYVSTTHAITHGLQKQQGVPVTAILVKVADPLEVTVIKAGKILGIKLQKRTANLPQDIEKALLTFADIEVLPSKILVYGEKNIEQYKDELTSFPWMAQLPFLHLPKIEEMDSDLALKAICFAGATELNPEAVFPNYSLQTLKTGPIEGNYTAKRRVAAPAIIQNVHNESLKDEDGIIEEYPNQVEDQRALINRPYENYAPSKLISDTKLATILAPISSFFAKLPLPKGKTQSSNNHFLKRKSFIIPLALVLLFLLGYIFLPKAKVTIFLDLRVLEKDSQVTADPTITTVDEQNNKIPGKVVEAQVSGSGKGSATGSKEVGEAAKGTVIVYNATTSPLTLKKGTSLANDKGLKFTLEDEVQVASKSASAADPPSRSAAVKATAATIGPDSNIPAATDLKVASYGKSEVVAKVDQAFSGGVSKKVTVVTADDQKKLLAQVLSDLRKKGKEEIQAKLEGDYKILEEALSDNVTRQSYSKNISDQASEFTLDLSVRFRGTAYKDGDLKSIVSKLVETNIPSDYQLDLSQTETQADVAKLEKDGKLIFLAKFKAKLMPKLDQNKIKKDLSAKTPEQAKDYLRGLQNVIGSDIELKPSFPGPLQRLPVLSKNITLDVTAK